METEQINKFKKEFKALVYQKGLITESNNRIIKLGIWDENSSHEKAINKELQTRDVIKEKVRQMQKGVDYEEWLKMSKRLTMLQSKLKSVLSKKRIIEDELFNFKSPQ